MPWVFLSQGGGLTGIQGYGNVNLRRALGMGGGRTTKTKRQR